VEYLVSRAWPAFWQHKSTSTVKRIELLVRSSCNSGSTMVEALSLSLDIFTAPAVQQSLARIEMNHSKLPYPKKCIY